MSSTFSAYFIALVYNKVFILLGLQGDVLDFVLKHDKMNDVQYLIAKKALTNCPGFPQVVFSSVFSPTGVTAHIIRDSGTLHGAYDASKFDEHIVARRVHHSPAVLTHKHRDRYPMLL